MTHAVTLLLICALGIAMVGVADAYVKVPFPPHPNYELQAPDEEMIWWKDNLPEAYEILLNNERKYNWDVIDLLSDFKRTDPMCINRVTYEPRPSYCHRVDDSGNKPGFTGMTCHVAPAPRGVMLKVVEPCSGWDHVTAPPTTIGK